MDSQRNLVLTGFMGVGKSTVGALVAKRLARPFIDMDQEIESLAGKSIADIFAQEGEAAFRQRERALCLQLADRQGLVIATGGGALVDAKSRALMTRSGTIVCLSCEVNELVRRIDGGSTRPLLDSDNPQSAILDLLEERTETYATLPWHVDTTERSLHEIVTDVISVASAQHLAVRCPEATYPIHIGPGLLQHLGDAVKASGLPSGSQAVVLSNDVVFPMYGSTVVESLAAAGYDVSTCIIQDGERHKTLETIRAVYDALVRQGIDRNAAIIGLGGGVTGDIAGFAAATYLRGVRFVQVPTTLLAMVDASVGGKTGVDLPAGKNLVGAFKQPDLVLIDPSVLATLADEEIRSGLAETLKHGVLGDPSLFAGLVGDSVDRAFWSSPVAVDRITRALLVKIGIVEEDPFERGRRAVLNLGHTLGHALELLSGYQIRHGNAVAIGLVAAARLSEQMNLASRSLVAEIEQALRSVGLPIACPAHTVDDILKAMTQDKKRAGGEICWILPRAMGDVTTHHAVPADDVREVLIAMGARRSR